MRDVSRQRKSARSQLAVVPRERPVVIGPNFRRLGDSDSSGRHNSRLLPTHPSSKSSPTALSTPGRAEFRKVRQKIKST